MVALYLIEIKSLKNEMDIYNRKEVIGSNLYVALNYPIIKKIIGKIKGSYNIR